MPCRVGSCITITSVQLTFLDSNNEITESLQILPIGIIMIKHVVAIYNSLTPKNEDTILPTMALGYPQRRAWTTVRMKTIGPSTDPAQ